MATEPRELHEPKYSSYEDLVEGFGSKTLGMYVTKVFLVTINSPWDHYVIVWNTKPHDETGIVNNPNIKEHRLVWSKEGGAVIPYGMSPDEYDREQERPRPWWKLRYYMGFFETVLLLQSQNSE